MSTIAPAIQRLARQLVTSELARPGAANGEVEQALRACEKLRRPLTKFAGPAGFASLLSRALALAKRKAPSLDALRVDADGSLFGLDLIPQEAGSAEAAPQRGVILVAELLALLLTFIGESLTMSLVLEAWPDAAMASIPPKD
jgi:hypothetical protein